MYFAWRMVRLAPTTSCHVAHARITGCAPTLSSISAIEAACVKALDEGDVSDFRRVLDPASTMAICDMARNSLTPVELHELGELLHDLNGFIADHSHMYDDERDALFRRVSEFKRLVGV